ncbi:uncharacterized protein LOC131146168 isoform X2 [Malania oleifera]|uniref:uncharacterized protein LOC131146168 isoform X2 n=1 Tax=Malania oleifera TaxID=397392 RepID=UPI0025ADEB34|nr:uncharacterized protein LOC131146168 isoform X2 [Malania oleifera]
MPFCEVGGDGGASNGFKIFYKTYGHGPTKVLLIIGLAGTHDSWGPQIKGLTGTETPNDDDFTVVDRKPGGDGGNGLVEVCAFDNRGMGRSSVPTRKSEYTTKIMAKDAIALLDHLGWKKAHVFGHSMGAMIASKLAAMVPNRVLSLALLNVTGGGFQCFPKLERRTISIAIRFLRAKTPEQRAAVDLDTHYTKEYLEEYVGADTRRTILHHEYVKGISTTGMQSSCGFDGQINACWTHKMTNTELELIRSAGFLISIIHGRWAVIAQNVTPCYSPFEKIIIYGTPERISFFFFGLYRYDVIAQIYYARKLAEKLYPSSRMIDLHGGHLVSHERTEEVNQALYELIKASEMKISPSEWTNLPMESSGTQMSLLSRSNADGGFMLSTVEKLRLCLVYLFGLLVLVYEYIRRALRSLKPVRVGSTLT